MKMKKTLFIILLLFVPFLLKSQNEDCITAQQICSTQSLTNTPTGDGTEEILGTSSEGCLNSGENYSAWYRVDFTSSGTFEFIIDPFGTTDYDYAIYGPNRSCSNLGSPVRCSYAFPFFWWWTGILDSYSGVSEGAVIDNNGNTSDGFTSELNVSAGDSYYVLIDNFDQNSQGFTIDLSPSTASYSCTPLTINSFNLNVKKVDIVDKLSWNYNFKGFNNNVKYCTIHKLKDSTVNIIDTIYNSKVSNISLMSSLDEHYYYKVSCNTFNGNTYASSWEEVKRKNKLSFSSNFVSKGKKVYWNKNVRYRLINLTGKVIQKGKGKSLVAPTTSGVYYWVSHTYKSQKIIVR